MLWSSLSLSRSSRIPKKSVTVENHELGLKSLTACSNTERPDCLRFGIIRSEMLFSPSASASEICDLDGAMCGLNVEDEEDVKGAKTEDVKDYDRCDIRGQCRRGRKWEKTMGNREFPPPLPSLARTENLSCRMPWVMKRIYKSDGRLIIQEEMVKRHEFFRVHRGDGRLRLQLVEMDCNSLIFRELDNVNEEKKGLETEKEDRGEGETMQQDDVEEKEENANTEINSGSEERWDEDGDGIDEKGSIRGSVDEEDAFRKESSVMIIGSSSMPESCHGIGNVNNSGEMRLNSEILHTMLSTVRPVHS